jgi:hypothetical protein
MGANSPPAQKLTLGQRAEARTEHERRLLDEAGQPALLVSRVAQGFPAKVEDPAVLARIAAILVEHERERRGYGAGR